MTGTHRCQVCKIELSGWCWIAPEGFYCARHTSADAKVQQKRLTGDQSIGIFEGYGDYDNESPLED